MDSVLERTANPSRTLVLGLLESCLFAAKENSCSACPLKEVRINLSFDNKHKYVMELSDKEIDRVLEQYESCYENRLFDLSHW